MMIVLSFDIATVVNYDVISVTSGHAYDVTMHNRGHAYDVIAHGNHNLKTQHTHHDCRRSTSTM